MDFWLSNDSTFDPNSDTLLDTNGVEPLSANGNNDIEQTDLINTGSWSLGTKYVFFRADSAGVVAEPNEANNLFSLQIKVVAPPIF